MNSTLNRTEMPLVKEVDKLQLPSYQKINLDNGTPVYIVNHGDQDVVKIELVFKAGKWYQPQKLVSHLTLRMMREGTNKRSGAEIAEAFDFYGSSFSTSSAQEHAYVSLHGLSNKLNEQLPYLFEVLTECSFPEHELQTVKINAKQKLEVNLQKNDFLASRYFCETIWGHNHPFGSFSAPEDYDSVSRNSLQSFYQQYITADNCFIIVAGKFDDKLLSLLNKLLGDNYWKSTQPNRNVQYAAQPAEELYHYHEKDNAVQTSICVGGITIGRNHPDYISLSILNTILGGYFGSRLMKNIREEKGYTYGIHSGIYTSPNGSYLEISSDVGKDYYQATLSEIQSEISTLRNHPIDELELQTVKNYLAGRLLRGLDGPLRFSESLRNLIIYNLNTEDIHRYLSTLRAISSQELLEIANLYIDYDKLYKVSVG